MKALAVLCAALVLYGCKKDDEGRTPTVAGTPCAPIGAVSSTASGVRVTCRVVGDDIARWRY